MKNKKILLLIIGFVLIIVLGFLDYITGHQLSSVLIYFIPIAFVTWSVGLIAGILASFVSTICWGISNFSARITHANDVIIFWNILIRFLVFLIIAFLMWHKKLSKGKGNELVEFIIHDLKVPIATNMIGLETLQDGVLGELNEQQKKIVDINVISNKRLVSMIDSILKTSQLEEGKIELKTSNITIKELIDNIIKEISVFAKRCKVDLLAKDDTGIEIIHSDYSLLSRILVNLLSNAIKVSKPETQVVLSVFKYTENMIGFCVSDQGPGIPKSLAKNMFNKYAQLSAKEDGIMIGSGIGLYFCKLAVKKLGGRIWMESEVGRGTKAIFILPVK